MPTSDDEWVVVRNCNWLHEAHFVKSVLEGDGIEAQIPDQHVLGVQPFYGAAIGGVRVFVRSMDLERATAVLGSAAEGPTDLETADTLEAAASLQRRHRLRRTLATCLLTAIVGFTLADLTLGAAASFGAIPLFPWAVSAGIAVVALGGVMLELRGNRQVGAPTIAGGVGYLVGLWVFRGYF